MQVDSICRANATAAAWPDYWIGQKDGQKGMSCVYNGNQAAADCTSSRVYYAGPTSWAYLCATANDA